MSEDFSFLGTQDYRDNFIEIVPPKPIIIGPENVIIPDCCREGWDDCPHIPKKQKKAKKNIGL